MVYLSTSAGAKSFKYIPRDSEDITSVVVYSESERTSVTVADLTITTNDYYNTLTASFDLVEDSFYIFKLKAGNVVKQVIKAYCSDQVVSEEGVLFITEDNYLEIGEDGNIEVSESYSITYNTTVSVNNDRYTSQSSTNDFIIL